MTSTVQARHLKVDLGCGVNKPDGWLGIDTLSGADIRHDLRTGIPLPDNSVEHLRAKDFLEHIPDTISLMNECWRVVESGGRFEIVVPRFPHVDAVKDPTHVRFFAVETFTQYLAGPDRLEAEYGMKLWDIVEMRHEEHRIWVTLTPRKS
jgi:Methyltransferase domain